MSTRVSHPLLRIFLLFAMVWAVSIPTAALAAPATQGLTTPTDEAVLIAYYETEEFSPADEGSGMIGLSFYDDDTFIMDITPITSDEDPVAGYGEYEVTDDGVTITLIGADGEDFDEPTEIELLWDADDTLVVPGEPDGIFGEMDVIFYPIEIEGDEDSSDGLDDDADVDSDDDISFAISGVYISPLQPYDGSDGVVYLLNLLDSGDASLNSDYLDLEAPIFETGTWEENEDGTVTVIILGTVDEEYDDPIYIELAVGEFGELMLESFSFYPIEFLNFLEEDETADEELGSEDTDVFIYVAEVDTPGEDEPIYIYMFLYDDGSVIMTDADETTTLYGDWTFEEEILAVSLTTDGETEFDEPGELVFELNEDDALVATEYPVDVFGEGELIFYPSDESEEAGDTAGDFYFYESDPLPSLETDGIIISVVLSGEGDALVSTDYMDDEETYMEYGTWTRDDDGNIVIAVTGSQDEDYDEPFVFTFSEDDDDLSLTLIEESTEIFGEEGLVLYRIE